MALASWGRYLFCSHVHNMSQDLHVCDFNGNSILHWLTFTEWKEPFEKFLKQHSLDPNIQNLDGTTPLCLTAKYGNVDLMNTVQILYQLNMQLIPFCNVNLTDHMGQTALHYVILSCFYFDSASLGSHGKSTVSTYFYSRFWQY